MTFDAQARNLGPMSTLQERARAAYETLPRDAKGKLPSYKSLEKAHDIPAAALSKMLTGARDNFEGPTLRAVAAALQVTMDYLTDDKAEPMAPVGVDGPPSAPRAREPRYASLAVVLVAAEAAGYTKGARDTVATLALKAASDPGEAFWWTKLREYEKRIAEESRGLARLRAPDEKEAFDDPPVPLRKKR